MESKMKWYKEIYSQNRKRLTDLENKFMVAKGNIYQHVPTALFKMDNHKDLLYSTWTLLNLMCQPE